jgi:hypothetical protein
VAVARPTVATSSAEWSSGDTRRALFAGGLAALVALGALGLAGVARSPTALGLCAELTRLPFPHFRVLPCPRLGTTGSHGVETEGSHALVGASGDAGAPGAMNPARHLPSQPRGHRPPITRVGGFLGTAVSKTRPSPMLKAIALALLAAANALLLSLRWRLGRLQGR